MASRTAGKHIALRAAAATLSLSSCVLSSSTASAPICVVGGSGGGASHARLLAFAPSSSSAATTTTATASASASASATAALGATSSSAPPSPDRSATMPGKNALPQRPLRYLSGGTSDRGENGEDKVQPPLDLTGLDGAISASEGRREEAFALSRRINMCLAKRRFRLERGEDSADGGDDDGGKDADLKELMDRVLQRGGGEGANPRAPRDANLSLRVEDYVRILAYEHFLSTGTLLPPSSVPSATDEEYLGGACIGLSRDLERYGVGRATERDAASVGLARDLVADVLDRLLLFDFRNGPLRRKYDGTKYALRTLETVLYELSVTGASVDGGKADDEGEPDLKKMRVEESSSAEDGDAMDKDKKADGEADDKEKEERIPAAQIEAIRLRMEHRDLLREKLIKRCRDGQKAAKQSIYALHRGDIGRARKLIAQCEECVQSDLLPIVEEEPGLRYGSFGNVMEEYAEARLFYAWLVGKDEGSEEEGATKATKIEKPAAVVLQPDDFPLSLEPAEYLGGLCDLTGEVGRFAVQRGTARDSNGVRLCLGTNMSVLHALETLNRFPSGGDIGKKMGPLRHSVQKLERMLYEMSLVEATGGKRNVAVESAHVHDGEKDGND